jgi:hypothetical protein
MFTKRCLPPTDTSLSTDSLHVPTQWQQEQMISYSIQCRRVAEQQQGDLYMSVRSIAHVHTVVPYHLGFCSWPRPQNDPR